ncbi:RHS repeat-associated core domain-containing protein [Akkermansia glycaniphila]|uniref:RHS repeat-associated core domain-containing protein n=1 Tax=Akkermansia glycaniphila TaxID=1679444 RepID=UPI001146E74D|nr:RHS repeat-associated core domain-containing protein [Akkermansia glycaniphila]
MQIAEIDATDETAPYAAKTYRWDPSEPVATRPLALTLWTREGTARETLYYAHDLRKNVVSLFDGKGLRRASYQYDPYGNITSMEGDMAESNPYRFSSEHHDEDLGLVYYNYRHYNPTDGRWTSRDPIAERGGWNLYGFVGNRPIGETDQLGLYTLISARQTVKLVWQWERRPGRLLPIYWYHIRTVAPYKGDIGACPDCGCVFIWIHGFNVTLKQAEDSFKAIETSYKQAKGRCEVYGFTWPGDVPEVAFQVAIEIAHEVGKGAFSKFIRDLKKKCPKTRIHIGTHSLGARIVLNALQTPKNKVSGIGHVVLTNAAVNQNVLEPGKEFAQAAKFTESIHVVHSRKDNILDRWYRISQMYVALGEDGPEHQDQIPPNVHVKDCTADFGTDHGAVYDFKKNKNFWEYATQYIN